jgi:hypothetical protein
MLLSLPQPGMNKREREIAKMGANFTYQCTVNDLLGK